MIHAKLGLGLLVMMVLLTATASAARAEMPPDVVRMKDGSFVRGLILERVEGDRVVLQTATGEIRTVGFADIEYAGPATSTPAPAPTAEVPASPPPAPSSLESTTRPVRFTSAAKALTLHELVETAQESGWGRTGKPSRIRVDSYESLCQIPCEIDMPEGLHAFGISSRDGDILRVPGAGMTIDEAKAFEVEYESRANYRVAGWTGFAVAELGALVTVFVGVSQTHGSSADSTPYDVGATTLAVGGLLMLPLAFYQDHLEIFEVGPDGVRF